MKADVLRQTDTVSTPTESGYWTSKQDPITGEILRVWVPVDTDAGVGGVQPFSIKCMARGIMTGGVRAQGTTEMWGALYENIDYVTLEYSAGTIISKRDRITNIRTAKNGKIIWVEEEIPTTVSAAIYFAPTVFEVKGVTPMVGPFGDHTSNLAILERADAQ